MRLGIRFLIEGETFQVILCGVSPLLCKGSASFSGMAAAALGDTR